MTSKREETTTSMYKNRHEYLEVTEKENPDIEHIVDDLPPPLEDWED